jgi:peptidyl-prolyl cis-trans isomerase D
MTMLDRMRRHKNWLKWSLGLVVLTFVLFYIPDFLSSNGVTGMVVTTDRVARVGSRAITTGEFRQRYQIQLQGYASAYGGTITDETLKQLRVDQQILQQMIDERAQLAEADRLGIAVGNQEVRARILAMPALQENGQFIGEARYRQLLSLQRPPVTPPDFEEQIRNALVLEKLRATLTSWITVSEPEVDREYRRRNEKVKLEVIAIPMDKFKDQITVSDAELASTFAAATEKYRIGEKRKIRYLLMDVEAAKAKAPVTDAQVEAEYNRRLPDYTVQEQVKASHILLRTEGKKEEEVRARAEDVLKQARAGGDFAQLAKKYSDDESNRDQGGDLDYFTRGKMVPEFEDAAFKLESGQISDLVKTPFGFHIIKIVDKKAGSVKPLTEVRQQLLDQLKYDAAERQVTELAQKLAGEVKSPADLERVAKAQGLMLQETALFGRTDLVPGLGLAPAVAQRAFELGDNEVSGAVRASRGEVLFTVTGKQASYLPKLDEVKDKVREDVIRQKAGDLVKQRATELAAALQKAPDFTKAAKAAGFDTQTTELVARETPLPGLGPSAAADQVAFSLPVGGVSQPIPTDNAYGIIKVLDRQNLKTEELGAAKDKFREELLNDRRGRFFASYMDRAKQKLRIEVDQDALQRAIG